MGKLAFDDLCYVESFQAISFMFLGEGFLVFFFFFFFFLNAVADLSFIYPSLYFLTFPFCDEGAGALREPPCTLGYPGFRAAHL